MSPRRSPLVALCFVLVLVAAPPAFANAVIDDARDGSVECRHSIGALRNAQAQISPEEAEYSDMDEAIAAALARKRAGKCDAQKPATPKGKVLSEKKDGAGNFVKKIDDDGDGTADRNVTVSPKGETLSEAPVTDSPAEDEPTKSAAASKPDKDNSAGLLIPIAVVLLLAGLGGLAAFRARKGDGDDLES